VRLGPDGKWPVAFTGITTNAPLEIGPDFAIYPIHKQAIDKARVNEPAIWPETLGVDVELTDSVWPTNLRAGTKLELRRAPTRDTIQFLWIAAGFYFALIFVALFWWCLSFVRHRRTSKATAGAVTGLLVPEAVMQQAEERWAKRVLGMCLAPNAD